MFYNLFFNTGCAHTIVVAPDYLGNVHSQHWKLIMTDSCMGIQQISSDIRRRQLLLDNVRNLVILLGRDDVLCDRRVDVGLAHLLASVSRVSKNITVWLSGAIARCHD